MAPSLPDPSASAPGCLTLSLASGPLHLIHSPGLPDMSGGYHAALGAIVHGGQLTHQGTQLTLSRSDGLGGRVIALGRDAAETVSNFAAQCDGWISLEPDPETDPELEALISGARREDLTQGEGTGQVMAQRLGFKLRLGGGVAPAHLRPPPWTLTPEGIVDRNGELIYAKVEAAPASSGPALGRGGRGEKAETKPEGQKLFGGLRKMLGDGSKP